MGLERDYTREGGVWNEISHWWEWRDDQGRPHRVDGPAVLYPSGGQAWWLHGEWHRADGPAVIHADGSQAWWLHGRCHRTDGPAYIHPDGRQEWYVQGRNLTLEVKAWMQAHDIAWPFTEEQRVEFGLRWG